MSSPTKKLQEWAGAIREYFRMGGSESTKGATPALPPPVQRQQPDAEAQNRSSNTQSNDMTMTVEEQMEKAKARYPGSKEWAKDEERLFEILYLRQDIPMLPRHWNVDFRGIPIPEEIFETTKEHPPRVYAHSKGKSKEFLATAALTRLIDLTLSVRTLLDSETPDNPIGQKLIRRRAADLIKETLEGYVTWASRDGGYDNPRVVPNIVVEVTDTSVAEDIVPLMEDRMKALARLQREYYREDRKPTFWNYMESWTMATKDRKRTAWKNNRRARNARRKYARRSTAAKRERDELSLESITPSKDSERSAKKCRIIKSSPSTDHDELGDYDDPKPSIESDTEPKITIKKEHSPTPDLTSVPEADPSPELSLEPKDRTFLRKPPVVYGLYVLGTSVLLLTMDSSKGDAGYVSFHVDINFADKYQSVWNALTVALAVCSARDELVTRLGDFEMVAVEEIESDPDV